MNYLYVDEKGPQETIRMKDPYDGEQKIKLGNDNMNLYVADMIKINEHNLKEVEEKYRLIEKKYLSYRNFPKGKELKGQDILSKNFKYGIASLKPRELDFYHSLFDLLLEEQVNNLLFSINKMSLVADNRLIDWIYKLEDKRFIESATLFKYSIVKYLEIEANFNVIDCIFDPFKGNKELLTEIQNDMMAFVRKNKHIKRMKTQVSVYKGLIQTIRNTKHLIQEIPFRPVTFDWNRVKWDIDLWITEMTVVDKFQVQSSKLILDEGIPLEPFKKLNFGSIEWEQKSENHVGLRISDVLVVISGNYITKLAKEHRYDKNEPGKRKQLSNDWFQLNERQFDLLRKMTKYFFPNNSTYCFVVDTYFDDALLYETYLRYISKYKSFNEFNSHLREHEERYSRYLLTILNSKWDTALNTDRLIKINYKSRLSGEGDEVIRPL